MFETNEQLQALISRAAAQQRQQEQIQRAAQAGDTELAHFYSLPPEQQATRLARQDIEDAAAAANAGDLTGMQQGIRNAVNRAVFQNAQIGKPERREPPPRRRVRR